MIVHRVLPPSCQCKPHEWMRVSIIPQVCRRFRQDTYRTSKDCAFCCHALACHAAAKETTKKENENGE